jgi:hypothetical protein
MMVDDDIQVDVVVPVTYDLLMDALADKMGTYGQWYLFSHIEQDVQIRDHYDSPEMDVEGGTDQDYM